MQVKLRVTGLLTEYFPAGKGLLTVNITEAMTVEEILRDINLNQQLVMTVVADGQRKDLTYQPRDGEEIVLISPVAGG